MHLLHQHDSKDWIVFHVFHVFAGDVVDGEITTGKAIDIKSGCQITNSYITIPNYKQSLTSVC